MWLSASAESNWEEGISLATWQDTVMFVIKMEIEVKVWNTNIKRTHDLKYSGITDKYMEEETVPWKLQNDIWTK